MNYVFTPNIQLSKEEINHLAIYITDFTANSDEPSEETIEKAYHLDNNTDPTFPDTAKYILSQVWSHLHNAYNLEKLYE